MNNTLGYSFARPLRRCLVALSRTCCGLAVTVLFAQAQPAQATNETGDIVTLDPFTVKATNGNGYVVKDTLASGRVNTSILLIPMSVQVIGRDLLDDVHAMRPLDGAMLVSGVTEGTIPTTAMRYTMRGIQGEGNLIDGFILYTDSANTDSINIDHVEVVKGPSALLFANGPIGGMINQITKSPESKAHTTIGAQIGEFDSNRFTVDATGPVTSGGKLLYRVVGLYQDDEYYLHPMPIRRLLFAPSALYKLSPKTEILFKSEYFKLNNALYNGIPWDFGTNNIVATKRGTNFAETANGGNNSQNERISFLSQLTSTLTDQLSMRLAGKVAKSWGQFMGTTFGGGRFNSLNGDTTFNANYNETKQDWSRYTVQNDYVWRTTFGPVKNQLLTGWDYSHYDTGQVFRLSPTTIPVSIFNFTAPAPIPFNPASTTSTLQNIDAGKAYAMDEVGFMDGRIIVSGGLVWNRFRITNTNRLTNLVTNDVRGSQSTKQYGVVFKPLRDVSVYYSYNENFQPGNVNAQGIVGPNQIGQQKEIGAKALLLNGHVIVSAAWYDASISNFSVITIQPDGSLTYTVLPATTTQGYEFDVNANLSNSVNLIFGYSSMDARSGALMLRGSTKMAYSSWVNYRFRTGSLKGLSLGIGATHSGARPGDAGNSFFLHSYTLYRAGGSYTYKNYKFSVTAENLANTKWAGGALNSGRVYDGLPRNIRFNVDYRF